MEGLSQEIQDQIDNLRDELKRAFILRPELKDDHSLDAEIKVAEAEGGQLGIEFICLWHRYIGLLIKFKIRKLTKSRQKDGVRGTDVLLKDSPTFDWENKLRRRRRELSKNYFFLLLLIKSCGFRCVSKNFINTYKKLC